MKPEQFIREFGVEKAREVVATGSDTYVFRPEGRKKYVQLSINDLKRLLESLDEIESYGGIELFKEHVSGTALMLCGICIHPEVKRLDRILKDHESIYGDGDET